MVQKSQGLCPCAILSWILLWLGAGGAWAANYYVTPSGAGDRGGTNWHNAYSNVQAAASLATNAGGDTIYLQWGVYSNAAQLVVSNAPNLILRGGCNGLSGGNSNDYSGTNSTLTRSGGATRIIYGCNSTATVAGVTVSGGYFSSGANNGAGLYFTNCVVTLTNCVVQNNTNACSSASYGAGICAWGGSLTLLDSACLNNTLLCGGVSGYGGGIAVISCPLVVRGSGSVFSNNAITMSTAQNATYGGAIFATNGTLTLDGATLIGNFMVPGGNAYAYGGAIYHVGSGMQATITGCWFAVNFVSSWYGGSGYGGAVFLGGATGVVAGCTFASNYISAGSGLSQGGGLYATGLQSLQVVSNVFRGNRAAGTSGSSPNGGALSVTNGGATVIDNCTFDGSGIPAGTAPELVYVYQGGSTKLLNSTLQNNIAGRGLSFVGAAGSALAMTNCLILGNNGNGLNFTNGVASLFNCLLAQNMQDGIWLGAGTVTVANCTLADNGGWGLNLAGGTGTVANSIAWGNAFGGVTSNSNLSVNYSRSQNAPYGGGASNTVGDPLFVSVRGGCYYLSVSGLTGQTASSPCIDAGSNTPASWGLDTRTTRTDGTNDTNTVVDLGYHYTNGVPDSSILTLTNCYVDAVNGSDASNGLSWASAWKSITHALTNVAANATINAATGTYSVGQTAEIFPLTVQMPGLTLAASNANPALTVVDNAGTNGQRVLQASGMGTVVLRGLTFRGGCFTNGENYGAGLKFLGCAATLTNCVVRDNTNNCTIASYGAGLYAAGGSLTILDSAFHNNTMLCGTISANTHGGGLAVMSCPLVVRGSRSVFSNNTVRVSSGYASFYGGAIYATNSTLTLDGATLIGNYLGDVVNSAVFGGGVCHVGNGMPATITGCWFTANSAFSSGAGGSGYGGAVFLGGATGVIANCTFTNNYAGAGSSLQQGGGIYAIGLQFLQVVSSIFLGNRVAGPSANGGALVVTNCNATVVDNCTIDGSGIPAGATPEQICVNGGGSTWVLTSTLRNNNGGRGVYFIGAAGSTLGMTNCLVTGNNGNGLTVTNGNASLLNCLLARNLGDGLLLAAGTVTVANCTLADNNGWGLNRAGGTGTVVNSIAWGNASGGILSNANVTVDYSCLQSQASGGVSNFIGDPLFANVPGCYYLSVSGLTGQTASSPCIDAGSNTPAFWGLDTRTTRTDGTNDTNTVVDLGYHYTNGNFGILTVTNCFVDAVNGNNASNGLSWASAWKSLTQALSNVAANATINVATGTYSAGQTAEIFPLTVQMPGLTLASSNADPALTVVDNAGTNGQRVLQASGMGTVVLRGLTFRGGRFTNGENFGAGLKFQGCAATLTNCVVRDNTNICTTTSHAGGVYAAGGSLTILGSAFYNNAMRCGAIIANVYGGGMAVASCPLVVRGSVFSNNAVSVSSGYASFCGGAIYATNGTLTLDDATLVGNYVGDVVNCAVFGGGICHVGIGMTATITGCWFAANSAFASGAGGSGYGGAVYLGGATGVVANCTFTNNYAGAGSGPQQGGGLFATGLQSLQVVSSIFLGNRVAGSSANGSALAVTNCNNAVVDHCQLDGAGVAAGTAPELAYVNGVGIAWFLNSTLQNNNAGRGLSFTGTTSSLALTNCLVVKNASNGLWVAGGTAAVVNCTLANNAGWGIARPTLAALTVKNSILWGNSYGGIGHNQNLTLTYTDSQDGWAAGLGAGNFSADPLFVNAAGGDFHEMGVEGSYHNGAWAPDGRNSPCLDAGDPASDWSQEPKPCGNRVNLGAYGNTAEATRSLPKVGTVLRIY